LNKLAEQVQVIDAESYADAIQQIEKHQEFELILLDKSMPGMSMEEGLSKIDMVRQPVVILSASENTEHMMQALALGVKGYIPKSSSRAIMLNALQLVLSGGTYIPSQLLTAIAAPSPDDVVKRATRQPKLIEDIHLTPRQYEVLALLSEGKTNKGIAQILKISATTVATHINTIFKALNVKNRTEAVKKANQLGFISI
jgi:DNA-binding NarL/FixJ family response regulator